MKYEVGAVCTARASMSTGLVSPHLTVLRDYNTLYVGTTMAALALNVYFSQYGEILGSTKTSNGNGCLGVEPNGDESKCSACNF